jgi:magnesium chelatase subunit D
VELAADATLRAMALRSALSGQRAARPILADLRSKLRLRPSGSLIVFALDASDSMNVERRMAVAKGAVMALLVVAQVTGDRVALVAFEGEGAEVVLQPTGSMARARARLRSLPTGGATPLAAGMKRALEVVRSERRRDPLVRPRILLSSDGEANVPLAPGGNLRAEIDELSDEIRREGIETVVLDTNPRFDSSGELRRLAARMGGRYRVVHDLGAMGFLDLLRS